jgi:hypothetical protein
MEGACCHPGAWFLGQPDQARQGRGELRGSQCTAIMSPYSESRYPARCPSVALPGDRIMEGAWIYIYKGK